MLDIPQVLLSDAAAVIGIEFNTLRSWIAREAVVLSPHDLRASGRGGRTLLTLRTTYHLAVMAELVNYGVSPGWSNAAATLFSRESCTYGDPIKIRYGGELFVTGKTYLIIFQPSEVNPDPHSTRGQGVRFRFVNVTSPDDYQIIFEDDLADSRHASRFVINCNNLVDRINRRLDDIRAGRRNVGDK